MSSNLELSRDDLALIDTAEILWIDEKACRGLNYLDPARHNLLINDGDVSIVHVEGSVCRHILRNGNERRRPRHSERLPFG